MHLLLLGHQKKLLREYWTSGKSKISKTNLSRLSNRLINLGNQVTCEFQRGTRSLDELFSFKATEYRFLLLYAGPFLFKDLLTENQWKHYMLLHTAVRLLSSNVTCLKYSDLAQVYLERYVIAATMIYGLTCQVMNMHLLVHLVDDVRYYGCCLNDFDAFCFENVLSKIRKRLKAGFKPLEQVCQQMFKEDQLESEKPQLPSLLEILKCSEKEGDIKIAKMRYKEFTLTKEPDNCVLLRDRRIINITHMSARSLNFDEANISLSGINLEIECSAFNYPLNSSILNMFKIKSSQEPIECSFLLKDILCKMVLLKIYDVKDGPKDIFAIPLLRCE